MTMSEEAEARIFEKLETIGTDVAVIKSQLNPLVAQLADHEKRLRSIEARVWSAVGVLGLLTFAIPIVFRVLFPT